MKLNINEITELKYLVLNKYVSKQKHPILPLYIYKYTPQAVFEKRWTDLTMRCRGLVLDDNYNIIANCIPKFFNYDELDQLSISMPNEPYSIFEKIDGSLIEVFYYNDELVVSSIGSFTSPQANVAKILLDTKYKDIKFMLDSKYTYLFELIHSENKIVVDYGKEEKLVLLAIRDTESGIEYESLLLDYEMVGFDVVKKVNMDLNELKSEIKRSDFINREGFVITFENGFRFKMKYDEYFRLHKIISNVNEKFVWEFISQGKEINLENIPDETFQFIKDTKIKLHTAFDTILNNVVNLYYQIRFDLNERYGQNNWTKKEFALYILPRYKKDAGMLFKIHEKKISDLHELIWKSIKPTYNIQKSGFQSMKF